jgi:hypothetical protein
MMKDFAKLDSVKTVKHMKAAKQKGRKGETVKQKIEDIASVIGYTLFKGLSTEAELVGRQSRGGGLVFSTGFKTKQLGGGLRTEKKVVDIKADTIVIELFNDTIDFARLREMAGGAYEAWSEE